MVHSAPEKTCRGPGKRGCDPGVFTENLWRRRRDAGGPRSGYQSVNLLRTLVREGPVSFDPSTRTYGLSMGVVSLAQGALAGDRHIRVLYPELQRLSLNFGVAMTCGRSCRKIALCWWTGPNPRQR